MSIAIIGSSVGRTVWYKGGTTQWLLGKITHVWGDGTLSIKIMSRNNQWSAKHKVLMFYGDVDDCPVSHCSWPNQGVPPEEEEES